VLYREELAFLEGNAFVAFQRRQENGAERALANFPVNAEDVVNVRNLGAQILDEL
jgi:hypothetical protein